MGYQESYVRMNNLSDFDKLVEVIREVGEDYYKGHATYPVEVITLKQAITGDLQYMCKTNEEYHFEEGEKFIYFTGERHLQRNPCNLLNNRIIGGVEIYFAESFPSDKIFNKQENDYAVHEEFKWS
ncbi:hypothetical protein [uncultured Clostridium sp.]|uniref:hypothetical protein n=1 Tax=uncultured Clostridium sp. TaxID=59620 RepID=UPI0028E89EF3|nr:hypothetical protein [uncultured Clostridium sp.]